MAEAKRSGCPINLTMEIVGDRWSLIVIRDIMFGNRRHFRELLTRSEEGISSNILADRLKHLVEQGMLIREDDPGSGTQTLYLPTEKALALMPVIDAMTKWGLEHGPDRLKPPAGWSLE